MTELYVAVKNIIIFMLLTTVLMNLLGKSGFKQYIRIFIGLVMILIVIQPVLKLFNADEKVDHYFNLNLYKINASDISGELYNAEEKYQEKIITEYRELIKEQINTNLSFYELEVESVLVEIESDTTKTNCGEILRIDLIAKQKQIQEQIVERQEIESVDQVVIDKININKQVRGEEAVQEVDTYDTVLELTIKKELVSLYGVMVEDVSVQIKE